MFIQRFNMLKDFLHRWHYRLITTAFGLFMSVGFLVLNALETTDYFQKVDLGTILFGIIIGVGGFFLLGWVLDAIMIAYERKYGKVAESKPLPWKLLSKWIGAGILAGIIFDIYLFTVNPNYLSQVGPLSFWTSNLVIVFVGAIFFGVTGLFFSDKE